MVGHQHVCFLFYLNMFKLMMVGFSIHQVQALARDLCREDGIERMFVHVQC